MGLIPCFGIFIFICFICSICFFIFIIIIIIIIIIITITSSIVDRYLLLPLYIIIYTTKRIAIIMTTGRCPFPGEKEFALQALGRRLDGRPACESVGGTRRRDDVLGFHMVPWLGWDGMSHDGWDMKEMQQWLGQAFLDAKCCYACVHWFTSKRLGLTRCWLYNEPFLQLVKGRIVSGIPYTDTSNQGFCHILSPIHPVPCPWHLNRNLGFPFCQTNSNIIILLVFICWLYITPWYHPKLLYHFFLR